MKITKHQLQDLQAAAMEARQVSYEPRYLHDAKTGAVAVQRTISGGHTVMAVPEHIRQTPTYARKAGLAPSVPAPRVVIGSRVQSDDRVISSPIDVPPSRHVDPMLVVALVLLGASALTAIFGG